MSNLYDTMLVAAIDAATNQSTSLRFGDVTAANHNTISVEVGGEIIPNIPVMRPIGIRNAMPTVGDRVWLLHQGSLMVCIGTTA